MDNSEIYSEEEEKSDNLIETALPVAVLPKDADLTVPPATGEEYLARVRHEASRNQTVVADIDVRKFDNKRTAQFFQNADVNELREEFKTPIKWQNEKCEEFARLVKRTRREKSNFLKAYPLREKLNFPKRKNDWYKFCFGKVKSAENVESSEESSTTELIENKPLLSILYNMSQASIVQLLDYQVEWVEELGYSIKSFEWIYALMCFLETPLLPETFSSLRSLARKCKEIRSELVNVDKSQLNGLNLFIAIIARHFSQMDLAD